MENCYNRVAPIYDRLAGLAFGERLESAQIQHLHHLPPGSEIAIVGGGSGSILDSIAELPHPPKTIYYVDSAPRMMALAQRRLTIRGDAALTRSVNFVEALADTWQPPAPVDALLTPYFLDCFDGARLDQMLDHLSQWLHPNGLWLVTDFTVAERAMQRMTMATMIVFFRITVALQSRQIEDYADKISALGFTCLDRRQFETIVGPVASEVLQKTLRRSSIAVAQSTPDPETKLEWNRP